jgi:hypothetical protein
LRKYHSQNHRRLLKVIYLNPWNGGFK